jgi:hypothetical protein
MFGAAGTGGETGVQLVCKGQRAPQGAVLCAAWHSPVPAVVCWGCQSQCYSKCSSSKAGRRAGRQALGQRQLQVQYCTCGTRGCPAACMAVVKAKLCACPCPLWHSCFTPCTRAKMQQPHCLYICCVHLYTCAKGMFRHCMTCLAGLRNHSEAHRRGTLPSGVRVAQGRGKSLPCEQRTSQQIATVFRKHGEMMPDPSSTSSTTRISKCKSYTRNQMSSS